MESPHSYILKTHTTIASSSSSSYLVNTHGGPFFLLLVFPNRWLENEVTSMRLNLLAPYKKVMLLSITSMVTFNHSFDHFPFGFLTSTLFVLTNLCIMFDII